ncbi:hypothetical protein ACFQ08_45875, partial [Streptosporangium algeriense]
PVPVYDERPYDVLVVLDGAQVLRALPGMPQVLRQGPRAGVYTLALDDDQRLLPEECATVADVAEDGTVRLRGGHAAVRDREQVQQGILAEETGGPVLPRQHVTETGDGARDTGSLGVDETFDEIVPLIVPP